MSVSNTEVTTAVNTLIPPATEMGWGEGGIQTQPAGQLTDSLRLF
jgi:hypothetical protein